MKKKLFVMMKSNSKIEFSAALLKNIFWIDELKFGTWKIKNKNPI